MPEAAPTIEHRRFRDLYREQYAFVWHTLRRFGIDAPNLDDVVQETFIVAYRRRTDVSEGSTRSWLYGISRRVASNHRRSTSRRERRHGALRPRDSAWTAVPEATVALHALDAFLQTLELADREIFVLSELEGLTGPELSEALGRNMATLYSRVRILRRRFLAFNDDGEPAAEVMRRVERERPRATMQGWLLLLPKLGLEAPAATVVATGWAWPAWATTTMGGVGIGTVLGGVLVAGLAVGSRASTAPPPSTAAAAASRGEAEAPSAPASEEGPAARAPAEPSSEAAAAAAVETARAQSSSEPPGAEAPDAAPTRPSDASTLAAENALLLEAKQALEAGRPAEALRSAEGHQRRFPSSAQADLAAALRIEALCALGREAQARGEAALLLRTRPDSPVAERVRRACAPALMETAATGHGPS